jgi:hypothetical protein
MFINIVTASIRPQNLKTIAESINIPRENYRWIVVFDMDEMPDQSLIPDTCEAYVHKNPASISGNSQRNFAFDLIKDGYVYINDDDTTMHPELWDSVKDLTSDFISFEQLWVNGERRLTADKIEVNYIDSHNFMLNSSIIKGNRFRLDIYQADGFFANACYQNAVSHTIIHKPLSVYNTLRPE